jgi:hypothetical protein
MIAITLNEFTLPKSSPPSFREGQDATAFFKIASLEVTLPLVSPPPGRLSQFPCCSSSQQAECRVSATSWALFGNDRRQLAIPSVGYKLTKMVPSVTIQVTPRYFVESRLP